MRRQYKGRSDSLVKSAEGEQGFWPSYADMMSAVALILFFLMLLSYIQNLITGNDLRSTQAALDETRITLADTEDVLALTLCEVEDAEDDLAKITIDLDEAKLLLAQQQEELAAQDQLLEDQIRDSMVSVMGGDAGKVSIGSNGNIILSEGVLFDWGSSEIKAEAAPALSQLIEVFSKFLSDDENAKYVDSIVISGHTDSSGTDQRNRVLSTDRANAVLSYLLDNDDGRLDRFDSFFCAAGYGKTRPVASNATEAGRAANRRIEISIILRDDTVMDIVESYLDIDMPTSP